MDFSYCPLVEAGYVDGVRAAVGARLVVLKGDVGARETAVRRDEVVHQIPCGERLAAFGGEFCLFGFFGLFELELLALLWGGEDAAEGGRFGGLLSGRFDRLGDFWLLELGVERELEFEVVEDDEFEFLAYWSVFA